MWRVSTRLVKTAYRSPASGMIEAGCRPACSMNSRTRRYREVVDDAKRFVALPETTYGTSGTAPAVPDKSTPFRLGRVIVYLVGFRPPRHARVGHRSRGYAQPRQDPPLQDDPPAQNAEYGQHVLPFPSPRPFTSMAPPRARPMLVAAVRPPPSRPPAARDWRRQSRARRAAPWPRPRSARWRFRRR